VAGPRRLVEGDGRVFSYGASDFCRSSLVMPEDQGMVVVNFTLHGKAEEESMSGFAKAVEWARKRLRSYGPGAFKFISINDLYTNRVLMNANEFGGAA
jgi:hypothetical protein